jgi:hypothetical protein
MFKQSHFRTSNTYRIKEGVSIVRNAANRAQADYSWMRLGLRPAEKTCNALNIIPGYYVRDSGQLLLAREKPTTPDKSQRPISGRLLICIRGGKVLSFGRVNGAPTLDLRSRWFPHLTYIMVLCHDLRSFLIRSHNCTSEHQIPIE